MTEKGNCSRKLLRRKAFRFLCFVLEVRIDAEVKRTYHLMFGFQILSGG